MAIRSGTCRTVAAPNAERARGADAGGSRGGRSPTSVRNCSGRTAVCAGGFPGPTDDANRYGDGARSAGSRGNPNQSAAASR
jgi:hypothetical protein